MQIEMAPTLSTLHSNPYLFSSYSACWFLFLFLMSFHWKQLFSRIALQLEKCLLLCSFFFCVYFCKCLYMSLIFSLSVSKSGNLVVKLRKTSEQKKKVTQIKIKREEFSATNNSLCRFGERVCEWVCLCSLALSVQQQQTICERLFFYYYYDCCCYCCWCCCLCRTNCTRIKMCSSQLMSTRLR